MPSHALRLHFETPLRVKKEGRTLGPQALTFGDFFGALLRRVSMLCAFHSDAPLEAPFAELMQRARQVSMRCALDWERQRRYSARQQQSMPMDGLTGWIEIESADAAPFWPFLWLGQFVHAGSAATMGLGCYTIKGADAAHRMSASLPVGTAAA